MTDTELIDKLEAYIKKEGCLLIHNYSGASDPNWPKGWTRGGLGLVPYHPRTLRQALQRLLD